MHVYFDCFSGISGDMTLAAFLDLGVPFEWLNTSLEAVLPKSEFSLLEKIIKRKGIQARDVTVNVAEKVHARDYAAIQALITASPLKDRVRNISLGIFSRIAEAEAKIHGCPVERVHFHEVGAIDSIVDIVGTALCVDYLNITSCSASPVPLGSGFVTCRHGTLPVPAPATLEILKGIPVKGTDVKQELVTPTGAAIIATLSDCFENLPEMMIEKIGYGAGKKEIESVPNLLRVIIGERVEHAGQAMVLVETCIDDMNPEIFGFLMERLFEDGALDVCWIPVFMKKNRPGTLVQVLCGPDTREKVAHRILTETTTLGVRYYEVHRQILHREEIDVTTSFGVVKAKKIVQPDGSIRIAPEYEECRKIAMEQDLPIKTVFDIIFRDIKDQ